jgi:hypothetical protein
MLRTNGLLSPIRVGERQRGQPGQLVPSIRPRKGSKRDSPCRVTMLAIWMTGSISGSGKIPLRPAHSISNERIRSGAIPDQSPSAGCEIRSSCLPSSHSGQASLRRNEHLADKDGTHWQSISYWQFETLFLVISHRPGFSSSQFMPRICSRIRQGSTFKLKNDRKINLVRTW